MRRNTFVYALCSLVLLSLLAACGQTDEPTPGSAARNRFDLDMSRPDEAHVTWEGYTDGYQPGSTDTMRLAIDNKADQPWDGRFCVQLLEPKPSSVVIPLAEQEFNLESGSGFARDVQVDLPADLAPGIHGLALVVHEPSGPIVDVTTVQVGRGEREPFQGEWPTEAALEACPAPNSAAGDPTG
jgi:hypothetical protein